MAVIKKMTHIHRLKLLETTFLVANTCCKNVKETVMWMMIVPGIWFVFNGNAINLYLDVAEDPVIRANKITVLTAMLYYPPVNARRPFHPMRRVPFDSNNIGNQDIVGKMNHKNGSGVWCTIIMQTATIVGMVCGNNPATKMPYTFPNAVAKNHGKSLSFCDWKITTARRRKKYWFEQPVVAFVWNGVKIRLSFESVMKRKHCNVGWPWKGMSMAIALNCHKSTIGMPASLKPIIPRREKL